MADEPNKEDAIREVDRIKAQTPGWNRPSLVINRVPTASLDWFKSLAEEEFCGHYGLLLHKLCEVYKGLYPFPQEAIIEQIEAVIEKLNELDSRMKALESPPEQVGTMRLNGQV